MKKQEQETKSAATRRQERQRRKPRKPRRFGFLGFVLDVVLFALIGVLLLNAVLSLTKDDYAPELFGYKLFAVSGGSMEPKIPKNSLVAGKAAPEQIAAGTVIVYKRTDGKTVFITHRVIEVIDDGTGSFSYRTKGDANGDADAWLVPHGDVVAVYEKHAPGIGAAVLFLSSWYGLAFMVCIILLIILYQSLYHWLTRRMYAFNLTLLETHVSGGAGASTAAPTEATTGAGAGVTGAIGAEGVTGAGGAEGAEGAEGAGGAAANAAGMPPPYPYMPSQFMPMPPQYMPPFMPMPPQYMPQLMSMPYQPPYMPFCVNPCMGATSNMCAGQMPPFNMYRNMPPQRTSAGGGASGELYGIESLKQLRNIESLLARTLEQKYDAPGEAFRTGNAPPPVFADAPYGIGGIPRSGYGASDTGYVPPRSAYAPAASYGAAGMRGYAPSDTPGAPGDSEWHLKYLDKIKECRRRLYNLDALIAEERGRGALELAATSEADRAQCRKQLDYIESLLLQGRPGGAARAPAGDGDDPEYRRRLDIIMQCRRQLDYIETLLLQGNRRAFASRTDRFEYYRRLDTVEQCRRQLDSIQAELVEGGAEGAGDANEFERFDGKGLNYIEQCHGHLSNIETLLK